MNLSELIDNTNYLLNEDGLYRTSDTITKSLNDGYTVMCAMTHAHEVSNEYSLNAGYHFMLQPASLISPVAVYANDVRLYPTRVSSLDMQSETWLTDNPSEPLYYAVSNLFTASPRIWVYPRASETTVLRVVSASLPDTLSNAQDVPLIPYSHHNGLVLWAVMWELIKERASVIANKAFRVMLEFIDVANSLRQHVYHRTPNRDWQIPPLEAEAIRSKMHDFFKIPKDRIADTFTAKDMSQ